MAALVARPTVYNGIQMRSRLEATFASFLDRQGLVWTYERRAFGTAAGQYLPDFEVQYGAPHLYVEIKGQCPTPLALHERMEIILASDPTAWLAIIVDDVMAADDHFSWYLWLPDGLRFASFAVCPTCHQTAIAWSDHVNCRCGSREPAAAYLNPFHRVGG